MYHRGSPGTATTVGGTSVAPAYPSTTQVGDLLVLFVAISNNASPVTTPTGFTLPTNPTLTVSTLTCRVYFRIADGTESGTATVSWTGSQNAAAVMAAFQGFAGMTLTTTDATASSSSSTGTSSGTTGSAGISNAFPEAQFGFIASVNTTGVDTITPGSSVPKVVEVDCGTTPFVSVALASYIQKNGSEDTTTAVTATFARTTTQNWVAVTLVRQAFASAYSEGSTIAGISNTEGYTFSFAETASPGSSAPVNLEPALIGSGGSGGSSWPTDGQGWPRIKQG